MRTRYSQVKLTPPSDGKSISLAFVPTDGATVIDFGPLEVFQDAGGPDGIDHFQLFNVDPSKNPTRTSGMTIIPDYSFDNGPAARIVVIRLTEAIKSWSSGSVSGINRLTL
jgi:hypothetical protein